MVSLSGICLLKGETVPQKTEWKGGRLIYDGVIIKNQFNLPQKGIKYHDEDRLSYDVMDTTIEMSTTLSKIRNVAGNGVTRESAILLSNIPVRFPIRQMGALSISNHTITTISGLMKKIWGMGDFVLQSLYYYPNQECEY